MKSKMLFGLVILVFYACNTRAKEEKLADKNLNRIESLIKNESYNDAKKAIDSIHILFPRLVNKRKIASALKDTIIRRQSSRNLLYCEKILPQRQHELDSLAKKFKFEKDENYQEIGNYIYKTQITELNTYRNYLKSYVDEKATIHLVSYFTGLKINHKAIKVEANELNIVSDTTNTSNSVFHSFSDGGLYWESLSLKKTEALKLVVFITRNYKSKIKITLIGNKKKSSYILSEQDKKAIYETYQFWMVKKDVVQLEKEILKAKIKTENIKLRYKN